MNNIFNKYQNLELNLYFKRYLQLTISIMLIIIIIKSYYYSKVIISLNDIKYKNSYSKVFNKYYLYNLDNPLLYFNLTYINYSFSFKFKIVKVEYNIEFYNDNNDSINPSDLTLYNNLHIICHYNENNNINIDSLANINNNKVFKCLKFFRLHQKVKFSINILKNQKYINFFFFDDSIINYNSLNNNNYDEFDPLNINKLYISLIQQIKYNKNEIKSLKLKKSYIQHPNCYTKNNINITNNDWVFINIYNNYFCLCKGNSCSYEKITQTCKYYFYLNIIDINKNIYNKTDYLFGDFIFESRSSNDVYPIFKEMIRLNFPSHYLTEKKSIYKEYCKNNKKCLSIILVNKNTRVINGNFLEKYLTLFLKLKAAITGARFLFINNLFYNIDYITFISVGHGIAIFKKYLYSGYSYYGHKRYNKILLPPSEKIIAVAKKKGWRDINIIKINLPRWDKYAKTKDFIGEKNTIKNNSIFIMFTWRKFIKNNRRSLYYINNIFYLLNDNKLKKELIKKKILLYFTLHPKLKYLKNKFAQNKHIIYLNENEISNCLEKTSLLVTDFSSIIFDIICRKKPYIIFIPDVNDPQLKNIYKRNIYKIIKSFKKNTFKFENVYYQLNETINKIIYYINNSFILDKKLKKFYTKFNFKSGNNIQEFIYYLKKLK